MISTVQTVQFEDKEKSQLKERKMLNHDGES